MDETSYRIEAKAKEPKGPPLRLCDISLPHEGADDETFARLLESHGLASYVDGVFDDGESVRRASPKVGRNEPCPCGSGKKAKKCCHP